MLTTQYSTIAGEKTKYDTILDGGKYLTEYQILATVGSGIVMRDNTTFAKNSGLVSVDADWGVFGDSVAVGCVQARQIIVKLRLDSSRVLRGSSGLALDARLINPDSGQASDWLHCGRFFVSRRKRTGDILELTCYDAALKAQGDYFANGADIGEWPRKMKAVAAEIASRIDCSLSIPADLPDYDMAAPLGLTMREILASMAAAWGGNWVVRGPGATSTWNTSWSSNLRFLPLGSSLGTINIGKGAMSAAAIGDPVTFTGVRMYWSDSDCFEAGNCDSKPLEGYCEWATQEMTDNVWNAIRAKTFRAFEATSAWLHPAVEPGDAVTVNGIESQIITMKGSLGAGCAFDISFPGTESDEDEYPYEGPVTKTLAKKVSLGRPYYGASISREQGLVIQRSDGASEAILNSDIFSMRAKNAAGQMIDCIYFDALAQLYRITGQVQIDGSLVTQNLYADEGEIVNLTVDKLLTSRRISKYILGDTTADDYISIQGNSARWINANVMVENAQPTTEQARNADGEPIYWTADPITAQVVNGHYEVDGKRVATTVTDTGWPVTVYRYSETQSLSITFGPGGGWPIIQFGSGQNNRAIIMKRDNGLQLDYVGPDGQESYILLGSDGRISCRDSLSSVDLSSLDNGTFAMNYNGKTVTYGFEAVDGGYKLTKPSGEGVIQFAT